jgi:cytochrome d ubiquinol oxidase subunit II
MNYADLWFVLWGVLWAIYFALGGFDLGAGILSAFLPRSEAERAAVRGTLGPVWNGNEVWLITAGAATFAAFPATYALLFSALYSAMLLLLFALIFRGIALEFRAKAGSRAWKRFWDAALAVASFLAVFLLGVAFGNLFQGLPIDGGGYHGTLISLLNPYGLETGVFFTALFLVHGSLWIAMKTGPSLGLKALRTANILWYIFLVAAAGFLALSILTTHLSANYLRHPVWLAVPAGAVLSLVLSKLLMVKNRIRRAFLASVAAVFLVTLSGIMGLYPNLVPSRLDPAFSLTVFNSSSSPYTLKIMSVVALIFIPIVIAYQAWVYHILGRGVAGDESGPPAY